MHWFSSFLRVAHSSAQRILFLVSLIRPFVSEDFRLCLSGGIFIASTNATARNALLQHSPAATNTTAVTAIALNTIPYTYILATYLRSCCCCRNRSRATKTKSANQPQLLQRHTIWLLSAALPHLSRKPSALASTELLALHVGFVDHCCFCTHSADNFSFYIFL